MIDIALIRKDPDRIQEISRQKNVNVDIAQLLQLDENRRNIQQRLDETQRQRNELSQGTSGTKPSAEHIERGKTLKQQASQHAQALAAVEKEYHALLQQVPNIPSDDTPVGTDESANAVVREWGTKPTFDFTPKPHWELGEQLGIIDSTTAAHVSGSRFTYLKGQLVHLQFALIQHALSVLTNERILSEIASSKNLAISTKPFIPVIPPVMIRPDVFAAMGRLEPKEERYYIPSDDLYLVGSAEHTLGPMHMNHSFSEEDLPARYVGYSTSFRREAGSHGKDVRGILRLHQFDKLEIESFTTPEASTQEQDFIVGIQEYLMQSLEVPYRVVQKCTWDMGTPNFRAIDIETWMPGQDTYRETHTSDHMTDYQARRLRTKVKYKDGSSKYVHMNDATVFAIGRTLIAIMENYQQKDGSITIPSALASP